MKDRLLIPAVVAAFLAMTAQLLLPGSVRADHDRTCHAPTHHAGGYFMWAPGSYFDGFYINLVVFGDAASSVSVRGAIRDGTSNTVFVSEGTASVACAANQDGEPTLVELRIDMRNVRTGERVVVVLRPAADETQLPGSRDLIGSIEIRSR